MRFHWLKLRAIAHATEDPEKVRQAMAFLAAMPPEELEVLTEATKVESHHGIEVWHLEATIKRAAQIRRALAPLKDPSWAEEADARTDDDGVFYARYDKQAAFRGRIEPTRGGDAVQVRLKPEVHPAGRERAMDAVRAWIGGEKATS